MSIRASLLVIGLIGMVVGSPIVAGVRFTDAPAASSLCASITIPQPEDLRSVR